MMDITTYCDVIDNCTDCPRYGDDCDGDKRVERTDYISRADAIKAVASITMSIHLSEVICGKLLALPSADADGEDLIIKGAKGIQDGLYNITDGKLFKYKAKGGTVRTYPIVPSADAVQGEWVEPQLIYTDAHKVTCTNCGGRVVIVGETNFCPNCGARMKGGDSE